MNNYTRLRIINMSIKLISKKGYDATRTKDIANLSGVSEATLFKYFKSKESLLIDIMNDLLNQFRKELKESIAKNLIKIQNKTNISYSEILSNILINQLEFFQGKSPLITIITREMLINNKLKDIFINTIYDDFNNMVDVIISKGNLNNQFNKDINTTSLKDTIFSVLIYYSTIHPNISNKAVSNKDTVDLIIQSIS